jgi:hypothetical protein
MFMPFGKRRSLWWLTPLRDRPVRSRVYLGIGLLIFAVAMATIPLKRSFDFTNSDGRWYYAYLPSLVVDGDLDFTNQMRDHWGTDWHPPLDQRQERFWHTESGLIRNKYPIGPALTLTPSFLMAHVISIAVHAISGEHWCIPDGYSAIYQIFNLLFMLFLTARGMALTDELLTEGFGVNAVWVVAAVVLYWLGTPLLWYSFREPYMAHVVGLFWVTATIYLCWRIQRDVSNGQLLSVKDLTLLAVTSSMALLCRPTNAFLLPFHLWLLVTLVHAGQLRRFLCLLPVAIFGLFPFGVQLLVWRGLYGVWVSYTYGEEGFYWLNPALWQTLFSSRHGLFFWSPLLLAALVGLVWHWRRSVDTQRGLLLCFAASFVLLWYCNSSWWCWYFGEAFGARAFLELSSLFIIGLAGAFEAVRRSGPLMGRLFASAVAIALVYHAVLFSLYSFHLITRSDYLF